MRLHKLLQNVSLLNTSGARYSLLSISFVLAVGVIMGHAVTAESVGRPAITVVIVADGQECEWQTSKDTVGSILNEFGMTLGDKDRTEPALGAKPVQGQRIRVIRVEERIVIQKEPTAFETVTKFDPKSTTAEKVIQEGKRGEKEVKYLVTYEEGQKIGHKVLEARVLREPVDEVIAISPQWRPKNLSSRSGSRIRSMTMVATAYAPFHCGGSPSGRTATGVMATKGIVAVDPRVIPLGTKLYVEGYGHAVAADTGGAIKGNRIDVCFDTYREAVNYGRRTVQVHILK